MDWETPSDADLEALLASYTEAWNREDVDAIEQYYHVPFVRFADGRVQVFLEVEHKREYISGWLEVNRKAGPATWQRLDSWFTRLGRNAVLVTTHWVFRRPDGSDVWDFTDTFQLCRFDDRWTFLSRTLHD